MPKFTLRAAGFFLPVALLIATVPASAADTGQMPAPVFRDLSVSVSVTIRRHSDAKYNDYEYDYAVGNPSSNTGALAFIKIDMLDSGKPDYRLTEGYDFPTGGGGRFSFMHWVKILDSVGAMPPGKRFVVVGAEVSGSWMGALGHDGMVAFATGDEGAPVAPGHTKSGLKLISPAPPTIRKIEMHPTWAYVPAEGDQELDPDDMDALQKIRDSITCNGFTLGPSNTATEGKQYWDRLHKDWQHAIELGWVPDSMFAQQLTEQFGAARSAFVSGNADKARAALHKLDAMVRQAGRQQLRPEARALIVFNLPGLLKTLD